MERDKIINEYKKHTQQMHALSLEAKERVKTQILSEMRTTREDLYKVTTKQRFWSFTLMRLGTVTAVILIVLTSTAYASSDSLPGDALYPVKRVVENARVAFTSTTESKTKLEVQFTEERLRELDAIETRKSIPVRAEKALNIETTALTNTTTKQEQESADQNKPKAKAEAEVTKAIGSLEIQVRKLNNKGRHSEAEELSNTIDRFKMRANRRQNKENDRETQKTKDTIQKNVEITTPLQIQNNRENEERINSDGNK